MSIASKPAVLRIAGLGKWFGTQHVLRDVDLEVAEGERVVVCGPSGSGKSTLARCVVGLERFEAGLIEVCGVRLEPGGAGPGASDGRVGMVFQQFNLFPHLTALQNCTMAPVATGRLTPRQAATEASRLLERVGLAAHAHAYPSELSGGQQQRVAIARALCQRPRLMIFDEPTSALDPETVGEVLDVMIEVVRDGMTMVCVTHELGFARRVADRMVFMDDGQVLEIAPPDAFFDAPAHDRTRRFLRELDR